MAERDERTGYWRGTHGGDADRLEAAARALEAGALPRRSGGAPGLDAPGPPFESWALRILDALGRSDVAAAAALAIGAMLTDRAAEGRLGRWAWAVRTLSTAAPEAAEELRAWCWSTALDVEDEGHAGAPGASEMKGKLRVLFGVIAVIAGRAPAPWRNVAALSAPLVAILASFERLWLAPAARDVEDAVSSEWIEVALSAAPDPVLIAFAGRRSSPARRAEVREALARPEVVRRVKERWAEALAAARGALSPETALAGGELLRILEETFSYVDSYLWVRSLSARGGEPAPAGRLPSAWSWDRVPIDVQRAVERVAHDPAWTSSIDVQRWGVAPLEADVVGEWFPRGLVELALQETIGGREDSIRSLLSEIPPGELRYYRGFQGIPPDADSLGLMLLLASMLPDPPVDRLASWLSLLPENVGPDGVPNIWLRRSAAGPTHDPPDITWAGDRCTACLLSLLWGLSSLARAPTGLSAMPPRCQALIPPLRSHVLTCLGDDGFSGCHHYDQAYATYLFFRVAARLPDEAMTQRRDAMAAKLLAEQRLDGSWGSPQRTAWMLEALCLSRPEPLAVTRAVRYLSETQRGDGGWQSEMVYFTVGKPGFMVEYHGIEVTTAMCARAMSAAFRARAGGWS
ncbi:hypothetical protein [Sorangium sp. So ce117]|uniref:hypothetical protein n=1 Tax=Sorangium sp. So ce117 TaxID=3133277 RepID=UPI003F5FFC0A